MAIFSLNFAIFALKLNPPDFFAVMTTLFRAKIPLKSYNFVTYMIINYTVGKKKGSYNILKT